MYLTNIQLQQQDKQIALETRIKRYRELSETLTGESSTFHRGLLIAAEKRLRRVLG